MCCFCPVGPNYCRTETLLVALTHASLQVFGEEEAVSAANAQLLCIFEAAFDFGEAEAVAETIALPAGLALGQSADLLHLRAPTDGHVVGEVKSFDVLNVRLAEC